MSRLLGVALTVAICGAVGAAAQGEAVTDGVRVRVKAEGVGRDDALRNALRAAIEQGAGAQIASFSEVENFTLIRDTIYSRASGLVSDYRILDETAAAGGVVQLEVEATVRPSVVAATWGEVQNVLDRVGRPRLMVVIDERIDGELQPESFVAARLEQALTEAGFDLVEPKAVAALRKREIRHADLSGDDAKLRRLAKEAGAHLLIRGMANANAAGVEDLYGVPVTFYNCDVLAKVVWTDTGKLLTTQSLPVTRWPSRGQRATNAQGARAALTAATFPERHVPNAPPPLGERLINALLEQWSVDFTAGGELVVEISGVNYEHFARLRGLLAAQQRIGRVDADLTAGTGTYRVRTTLSAEGLAELLSKPPFADTVEVVDLKPTRIQGKALRRTP